MATIANIVLYFEKPFIALIPPSTLNPPATHITGTKSPFSPYIGRIGLTDELTTRIISEFVNGIQAE
jgi:hypothetical protein